MTRCACERDGNTIPSPVAQQQRGDKGGKLFIKVLLECCTRQGKHRRGRTHKPPGTKAAAGQHKAREVMERHGECPGPSLPNDQEQQRGIQECQLKRDQKKHQGGTVPKACKRQRQQWFCSITQLANNRGRATTEPLLVGLERGQPFLKQSADKNLILFVKTIGTRLILASNKMQNQDKKQRSCTLFLSLSSQWCVCCSRHSCPWHHYWQQITLGNWGFHLPYNLIFRSYS